jgi:uncharacterized protein
MVVHGVLPFGGHIYKQQKQTTVIFPNGYPQFFSGFDNGIIALNKERRLIMQSIPNNTQHPHLHQPIDPNEWKNIIQNARSGDAPAMQQLKNALPSLRAMAEKGNPLAQYQLGRLYKEGFGVERDNRAAFDWFSKSARQGNTMAHVQCGIMRDWGFGCGKDPAQAFQHFSVAAEQGHPYAQLYLNTILTGVHFNSVNFAFGRWLPRGSPKGYLVDPELTQQKFLSAQNEDSLKELIGQGYIPARFVEAMDMYKNGLMPKALSIFINLADQKNYALAQFQCGEIFSEEGDQKKALEYYKAAMEQGHDHARIRYGDILFESDDKDGAKECYKAAWERSYLTRDDYGNYLLMLGDKEGALECYQAADAADTITYYKIATKKLDDGDVDGACQHLEKVVGVKAREKLIAGYPPAQFKYGGLLWKNGQQKLALLYYKAAADANYELAQYALAKVLSDYKKAPEQFLEEAQEELAELERNHRDNVDQQKPTALYLAGLIALIDDDRTAALEHFKNAAEKGDASAQYMVWVLSRDHLMLGKAVKQRYVVPMTQARNAQASNLERFLPPGTMETTTLNALQPELGQVVMDYVKRPLNVHNDFHELAHLPWYELNSLDRQYGHIDLFEAETGAGTDWKNLSLEAKKVLISWDNHGFKPDV